MTKAKVATQESGKSWTIYNGDCVAVAKSIPDNSLHYSVYSPPFISLYTFSDDTRDMSNCRSDEQFWTHYKFLIAEMFRATKPTKVSLPKKLL